MNMKGWSLVKDKEGKWRAVRRINGKMVCKYIGKDVALAEKKLGGESPCAWCRYSPKENGHENEKAGACTNRNH